VDAIGAKGFRASRSWFTKGIAAGNVRINGERATKGSEAAPGDEIWAEGLGWVRVESVEGETRRGNLKAVLTVEKT
jgi:RNA-binding protein YlmH